VIFPPFGDKALDELEAGDLDRLISEPVEEGLFVEYKSAWTPAKVARAVASFANSPGGGTLIVGVEADGLIPVKLVPLANDGQLEERVVQTIRSSVAPVPSFRPRAVPVGDKACIVVEVPEGTQPPIHSGP
jgi:predicted HTH transcriptional regulator